MASQVETPVALPAATPGLQRRVRIHLDGAPHWRHAEQNARVLDQFTQQAERYAALTHKSKDVTLPIVLETLKRSLEAVKTAHLAVKPDDLKRKVKVNKVDATVDGMYLRIIVHANEHMGQLVAYARMSGVTPPWSKE